MAGSKDAACDRRGEHSAAATALNHACFLQNTSIWMCTWQLSWRAMHTP